MMWKICFIVMVSLIGVSGASLYPIGDNYSVNLGLIPSADTYIDEMISDDNIIVNAMFTKFLGGNGETIIMILEYLPDSPKSTKNRMEHDMVDMTNETQMAILLLLDANAVLDAMMTCLSEGTCAFDPDITDKMDIKSTIENSSPSYAFSESPYLGIVAVLPVELETGEISNTFGSIGRLNEQTNDQTLKGYVGIIDLYNNVIILSTEPASVFRTIVGSLNVVSHEDKGQAVLDDIMEYL